MTAQSEFNEVFLDDVADSLPASLLGDRARAGPITDLDDGARADLCRLGMRNSRPFRGPTFRAIAARGTPRLRPTVRQRLAELYVQERAAQLFGHAAAAESPAGQGTPLLGSAVKIGPRLRADPEYGRLALQLLADRATAGIPPRSPRARTGFSDAGL